MSWIMSLAVGTCMVILVGGIVIAVWGWLFSGMEKGAGAKDAERVADLETRMAELERRLTDTQDIVISVSEKLDRLETTPGAADRELA